MLHETTGNISLGLLCDRLLLPLSSLDLYHLACMYTMYIPLANSLSIIFIADHSMAICCKFPNDNPEQSFELTWL